MTQGHTGIFSFALGKMLHRPFALDSLPLLLNLSVVIGLPLGTLHPPLSPSEDQSVHLQSGDDTRTGLEGGQKDGLSPQQLPWAQVAPRTGEGP